MDKQKNKVRRLLINEWAYKENQVDAVVEKIFKMDPMIYASFESWMRTGQFLDTPLINRCTPKLLHKIYPQKPPAIFLLLDWIRRDPDMAFKALLSEYGRLPFGDE